VTVNRGLGTIVAGSTRVLPRPIKSCDVIKNRRAILRAKEDEMTRLSLLILAFATASCVTPHACWSACYPATVRVQTPDRCECYPR